MADLGITVNQDVIQRLVEQAIEANINKLVDQLCADPSWTERVERQINQAIVHETLSKLGSIDLGPAIKQRVDENMERFTSSLLTSFTSTGIADLASQTQLTVMDDNVVVENCLTTNNLDVMNSAKIEHLIVTGSINTDNTSWQALAAEISQRTMDQITAEWNNDLVAAVVKNIQEQGINFEEVSIGGEKMFDHGRLSGAIVDSSLESVGTLKTLQVRGETHINNNTVNILNKRLGINTESPEMALSVWDEEVSVGIGKNKANEAYIGTNRSQSLAIGVNRLAQIEINTDGLTRIKQLQVGLHKISHATQVPGWAGTKGDIVFNANLGADRVFAWMCLGSHRWQSLKSAE